MDSQFWQECWETTKLGWQRKEAHPLLRRHWSILDFPSSSVVFVPLCGKNPAMLWLREQGHLILGIDLSQTAIDAFFVENNLPAIRRKKGSFVRTEHDGIKLLQGDFFALTAMDMVDVAAVYDRAALVAFPPEMRIQYVAHLQAILPVTARILLITFEHNIPYVDGPPHNVPLKTVQTLYGKKYAIKSLGSYETTDFNPRSRNRGLGPVWEHAYLLIPKNVQ